MRPATVRRKLLLMIYPMQTKQSEIVIEELDSIIPCEADE